MNSSNEHQRSHQTRANRIIQSLLKFSSVRHQSNSSDAANSKAKKKIQDNAGQSAEPFRFCSLLKNVRTQSSAKNSVRPSLSKISFAEDEMKNAKIPLGTLFFSSIFNWAFPSLWKLGSVEAANNPKPDEKNSTEEEFSDTSNYSEDSHFSTISNSHSTHVQNRDTERNNGRNSAEQSHRARSRSPINNYEASEQKVFTRPMDSFMYTPPLAQHDPVPSTSSVFQHPPSQHSPTNPCFPTNQYRLSVRSDLTNIVMPKNSHLPMMGKQKQNMGKTTLNDPNSSAIVHQNTKPREHKKDILSNEFTFEGRIPSHVIIERRRIALGLSQEELSDELKILCGNDIPTYQSTNSNSRVPFSMSEYNSLLIKCLTLSETLEKAYKQKQNRTIQEMEQLGKELDIDTKRVYKWFCNRINRQDE